VTSSVGQVTNDYKSGDKALLADQGGISQVTNDEIKEIVTTLEVPKVEEKPIKREEPKTSPYVLNFETLLNDALQRKPQPKPAYKYRFIKRSKLSSKD